MSLLPMLSWWQWSILAAVPPAIVLLYFLKLKRRPLEVPSTFLWLRSIEDLHVNSIWQKLRQNILLALQLLLILLAMLALLRPSWRGTQLTGDRFIFLVDNSASMQATDAKPTRLEDAKRRVGELVDEMASGDVAMIVSLADSAQVVQPFTDNRRELRRRLADIRPTNRSTSLTEALRVASGLANPGRASFEQSDTRVAESLPATLYIYSDGKFPDVTGFSLGNLTPVYVPIGNAGSQNVGITSLAATPSESDPDKLDVFARVENSGGEDRSLEAKLLVGPTADKAELVDASSVDIKAGGSTGVAFTIDHLHEGGVLTLQVTSDDDLKLDNAASIAVNPPRPAKVLLVTPGNEPLELALATERAGELADITIVQPDVLEDPEQERQAAAGSYDLIIYDRCQPKESPRANTLSIGRLPVAKGWSAKEKVSGPQVIDLHSSHPLTQLIDLGNVSFAEGTPLVPPPGSTVLIDSSAGPLMAISARDEFEDAALGVEIVGRDAEGQAYANTDWPLRLSWPIFVLNSLEYLGGNRRMTSLGTVPPGRPVTFRSLSSVEKLQVEPPQGTAIELRRSGENSYRFSQTDALGVYAVREGDKVLQRFAVNLFDGQESNITPRKEGAIQIGYVKVEGRSEREPARIEAWKPLLLLALGVLLGEWYIYNRRVYL